MAILQSTDKLEEKIGNKYSLVIVAAKRARQLREGHIALSEDPTTANFLSLALREIESDKVRFIPPAEEDILPAPRDVISSIVSGAEFDLDEEGEAEEGDAMDDLTALLAGADDDEEEQETVRDAMAVLAPVTAIATADLDTEEAATDEDEAATDADDTGDEEDAEELESLDDAGDDVADELDEE
jgi:DNA-directed RNA polymerase subunit omega